MDFPMQKILELSNIKCAKFRGLSATMGFVGISLSYHRFFVGIPCPELFLWVFRWSKIFALGYFVSLKFFSHGHFDDTKSFFDGIL